MGYSDKEENLTGIFDRTEESQRTGKGYPGNSTGSCKGKKRQRKDQSDCFFGPNVINMCRMADIVFMALHGENGENGKIQA